MPNAEKLHGSQPFSGPPEERCNPADRRPILIALLQQPMLLRLLTQIPVDSSEPLYLSMHAHSNARRQSVNCSPHASGLASGHTILSTGRTQREDTTDCAVPPGKHECAIHLKPGRRTAHLHMYAALGGRVLGHWQAPDGGQQAECCYGSTWITQSGQTKRNDTMLVCGWIDREPSNRQQCDPCRHGAGLVRGFLLSLHELSPETSSEVP